MTSVGGSRSERRQAGAALSRKHCKPSIAKL
jgi:hypothetical protein